MEDSLAQSVADINARHGERMDSIQDDLKRIHDEMDSRIIEQLDAKYTKWENDRAEAHAEYMMAKEDITTKMQDIVQLRDKTKNLVSMVHEARNKYTLAAQEVKKHNEKFESTIKQNSDTIKKWDDQMQRNSHTLAQIGTVKSLLQSVEARQSDMEQVQREAKQLLHSMNQTKAQWKTVNNMSAQVKETQATLHTINEQLSKLENDLVQAHAFWKRQCKQLDDRLQVHEDGQMTDTHIRHIADQVITAYQSTKETKMENRIEETVQRRLQEVWHALEKKTTEVQEELRSTSEQYTMELKDFIEAAAKLQHEELVKCGTEQQEELERFAAKQLPAKDTLKTGRIPEQVDIPTTDSQGGLSRRSVDPPATPPTNVDRVKRTGQEGQPSTVRPTAGNRAPTNPYRTNRSPPNPHRSNWTAADVRVQDRCDVTPPNPYRPNRLPPNPHQSNWIAKDDRVDDRQGSDRWHGIQVNDETTNAVIETDRTSTHDTAFMTPSQL